MIPLLVRARKVGVIHVHLCFFVLKEVSQKKRKYFKLIRMWVACEFRRLQTERKEDGKNKV